MYRLFVSRRRASLLVLERAEHRLLALDAHENAEDRRRDDDVAHGLVRAIVTQNARSGSRRELSLVCVLWRGISVMSRVLGPVRTFATLRALQFRAVV